MSMTDPIADMLTRIRNAVHRKHDVVDVPSSKMKLEISKILKEEDFVAGVDVVGEVPHKKISIKLKYSGKNQPVIRGLKRASRPGLRVYVGKDSIPKVQGGLGVSIVSTSQGVMTGRESKRRNIGGEVLCYIW